MAAAAAMTKAGFGRHFGYRLSVHSFQFTENTGRVCGDCGDCDCKNGLRAKGGIVVGVVVVGMGLSGIMTAKKKERVSIVLRRFGMGLPLQYLLF